MPETMKYDAAAAPLGVLRLVAVSAVADEIASGILLETFHEMERMGTAAPR